MFFALGVSSLSTQALEPPSQEQLDFFESKIRPALIQYCYECHSTEKKEASGDLLLDSQPAMLRGGTRGGVIGNGTPDTHLFWKAIQYTDPDLQMPPASKMPQETIDLFKSWLEMGAPDPRVQETGLPKKPAISMEEQTAKHWAYQPPRSSPLPSVRDTQWVRDPIDALILAKLESKELTPSAAADRRTLIKRLSFDLLGLIPTKQQIDAFEKEERSNAYEILVDSLLESPHFGERFARYWMDLTRYADTKGYVFMEDRGYPHAHKYRDWLIRSFNQDMPYDQFIRLQLAADRLDAENKEGHLDAMGMLTLGRRFLNNPNDIADDRIDVVTRGLQAMTVGCARCHDHKFDPVKAADYYSLHGVFANSEEPGGEPSPMRLIDRKEIFPSYIFLRGQPGNRGDTIERMYVKFLSPTPVPLNEGSGRLNLANAIVDKGNPLTARVLTNRLWGWLTGVPFVDSTSDFGLRCEVPKQQDVLDQLSFDFQNDNWSIKRLIRRIVLSSTYRQQSDFRPDCAAIDPENQLCWRMNRRRMDLETYRDGMLSASGKLDATIGGASVKIHEAPFPYRRTLYAYIDRQNLPGLFRSFDFASPDAHSPKRAVTTVPQQGLFALNSLMVLDLADELGKNALAAKQSGDANSSTELEGSRSSVIYLFERVLLRLPSEQELESSLNYVQSIASEAERQQVACWSQLAQALLATNEFCFID